MSHVEMDFSEITPFIFIGTNMCCSHHGMKLKDLGAMVDISLEFEKTEVPDDLDTFLWLPTKDHQSPSLTQLHIGTGAIVEAVERKYPVYVHCKNGHGRSPTLVIAYFIRTGMSADQAQAAVAAKRPEIMLTEPQKEMLKKFEQSLYGNERTSFL